MDKVSHIHKAVRITLARDSAELSHLPPILLMVLMVVVIKIGKKSTILWWSIGGLGRGFREGSVEKRKSFNY